MKIEFDAGKTKHGQEIKVVAFRETPGSPWLFNLVKLPADQRDDKVTIFNLPVDVIESIGNAATTVKGIKV